MTQPDYAKAAADANAQLLAHYNSILEKWNILRTQQEGLGHILSVPCFVKAAPTYFASDPKLVFVGQETHGWWNEYVGDRSQLTGTEISGFYEGLWNFLQGYRSPYWNAVREVAKKLGVNCPAHSFIFSNIFPCDVDKKRAPLSLHDSFRSWKVLPTELQILKPDYVIFFCGREYYGNLESYFGEMPKQFVLTASPLIEYQPKGVSWKGFVTYHPNYLKRSKQWPLLDRVIDKIKSTFVPNSDPSS